MSNPFATSGAIPDKQSKYAPLLINRFFTGQFSNSNPLNEGAVPFLYQRFYQGSRYEQIRSGQNVEISPRLTIIRRPGVAVYNSQTFPACATFYDFRVFDPVSQTVQIRVIADTATAVYDATGPNTKLLLWTKVSGAGQTSFKSVGNTLYAADGQSAWKWVWTAGWVASTTYTTPAVITDPNNNLQKLTQVELAPSSSSLQFSIANNVAVIQFVGYVWTASQLATLPGSTINLSNFVTGTYFNGTAQIVGTVYNKQVVTANAYITFAFTHGNVTKTTDNTGIVAANTGAGNSGSTIPSFSATIGATTNDNAIQWTNAGPAVEQWGINGPLVAPTVSNVFIPSGTGWTASTYYWPTPLILDSNANLQLLTTDGTTGTSVPVWSSTPGVTTADNAGGGTAIWTCQGPGGRATSHAYALGAFIGVTVTTTTTIKVPTFENGGRGTQFTYQTFTTTNFYFFTAVVDGTSSSTATGSIVWPSNLAGTVIDGTVTWANCGYQVTRTSVGTSTSPTANAKGTVGNSQAVTQVTSIIDNVSSGGGSGFIQNVVVAGPSAGTHPTWAVTGGVEAAGLNTKETSGLTWQNGGPSGAANTGTWIYGYSFGNSITKHESSMSPASIAITLAANSGISVSGNGDPNWATDGVDTIFVYRSVQGFTTPFRLASIPAPASGAPWSYLDVSPDPPNPASILNEFIQADTVGNNTPPPANLTNLTYYLNRVFGSSSTFQFYSGVATQPVGVGAESWPGGNFMQLPEVITKSWPSPSGLLMFTTHGVEFSQGIDGNGNPNTPIQILEDVGLLSPNLFTVNGSIPVILASDGQMLALDPSSGVTRYSDPIADSANGMGGFSTTASYLTWHVNGIDSAFYLADGSTGWFRLCPTAAPESGFTWSPKANIVNNCGAIGSIETSPGIKNLLISQPSGGQILKRDLTVSADNGVPYLANFIIGSIVLAQPNQCAELESVSTYCTVTGTNISVAMMGNEISTANGAIFEALTNTSNGIVSYEPPFLNPPSSVYATRWYTADAIQPTWLQHLQLQFTWPIEAAQNELMAFCLFGCVHLVDP